MNVFRLFKRKQTGTPAQQGAMPEVEGKIQAGSRDELPSDVVTGVAQDPPPEYIEEAATPSEDAWAREEARYRAKNEDEPPA